MTRKDIFGLSFILWLLTMIEIPMYALTTSIKETNSCLANTCTQITTITNQPLLTFGVAYFLISLASLFILPTLEKKRNPIK